jgi:thiamine biosynthesis lipoprotein
MSVPSNRRDFLTGRAIQSAVARSGEEFADALLNSEGQPEPRAFDTIRLETRAMACPWSVILEPGPHERVMIASDALSLVHELEAKLSVYRDDTDISRINRLAADSPQTLDADLFALLSRCVELWQQTDGAFDIAVRALILLWRRCREAGRIPTDDEIASALVSTGSQHLRLDVAASTIAFDRPEVGLDLGAIGKGYAADRAAQELTTAGMTDFVVHGGHSSVLARGDHAGQGGWPIGLKNPLFTDERYATLMLKDRALATSGSNIQYFRYQGRRYGHLLDPRTGWPADALLSVSVLAPTAADADALSTAFYVMGLEKAADWCHNRPEIGAILVPPPQHGRDLAPVLCNIPPEILFVARPDLEDLGPRTDDR